MFERFTERARQVVVLAQDEARALQHNYIGTEHILLGLLREEDGLATRLLEPFGFRVEDVRVEVDRIAGQGDEIGGGQIPFTQHARRVLDLAVREALALNHTYVGTEHILLSLMSVREGRAAEILDAFDVEAERVRGEVIRIAPARQTDGGFLLEAESKVELELRRVVPVARQVSDGTWVVSVELWDYGLVIRWRAPHRPPRSLDPENLDWRVSDDLGTSYTRRSGSGIWGSQRGYEYEAEFDPAPPPEATLLRIHRKETGDDLSVNLAD